RDVLARVERAENVVLAVLPGQEPVPGLLHHPRVLDVEGLVEAPLLADVRDVLRQRVLAGHPRGRIAARDLDEDEEDEEADDEEHRNHSEQPANDEGAHQCCSIRTFEPGSRASGSESPKMLSDRTVSTIASPGIKVSHGAVWI